MPINGFNLDLPWFPYFATELYFVIFLVGLKPDVTGDLQEMNFLSSRSIQRLYNIIQNH